MEEKEFTVLDSLSFLLDVGCLDERLTKVSRALLILPSNFGKEEEEEEEGGGGVERERRGTESFLSEDFVRSMGERGGGRTYSLVSSLRPGGSEMSDEDEGVVRKSFSTTRQSFSWVVQESSRVCQSTMREEEISWRKQISTINTIFHKSETVCPLKSITIYLPLSSALTFVGCLMGRLANSLPLIVWGLPPGQDPSLARDMLHTPLTCQINPSHFPIRRPQLIVGDAIGELSSVSESLASSTRRSTSNPQGPSSRPPAGG